MQSSHIINAFEYSIDIFGLKQSGFYTVTSGNGQSIAKNKAFVINYDYITLESIWMGL